MRKIARPFFIRPATVKIAAIALAGATLANSARADPMRVLGNLGDAHKSVGLITHYDINRKAHSLDVVAAVPSVSPVSKDVQRQLAQDTAREICSEGTAAGLSGWSVRIFMPGETAPTGSCRMGGGHH